MVSMKAWGYLLHSAVISSLLWLHTAASRWRLSAPFWKSYVKAQKHMELVLPDGMGQFKHTAVSDSFLKKNSLSVT